MSSRQFSLKKFQASRLPCLFTATEAMTCAESCDRTSSWNSNDIWFPTVFITCNFIFWSMLKLIHFHEMWSSHGSVADDGCLLGCDTVSSDKWFLISEKDHSAFTFLRLHAWRSACSISACTYLLKHATHLHLTKNSFHTFCLKWTERMKVVCPSSHASSLKLYAGLPSDPLENLACVDPLYSYQYMNFK